MATVSLLWMADKRVSMIAADYRNHIKDLREKVDSGIVVIMSDRRGSCKMKSIYFSFFSM